MVNLFTSDLYHSILPARLGFVIQQKRLSMGLTQKDLSQRTHISTQKISNIEKGRIDIKLTELEKISFGLNTSVKSLINEI